MILSVLGKLFLNFILLFSKLSHLLLEFFILISIRGKELVCKDLAFEVESFIILY
jgi:hypothetical protein